MFRFPGRIFSNVAEHFGTTMIIRPRIVSSGILAGAYPRGFKWDKARSMIRLRGYTEARRMALEAVYENC